MRKFTSRQKRIAEEQGIFDLYSAPGVAKPDAKPAESSDLKPFAGEPKQPTETDKNTAQAHKMMKMCEMLTAAGKNVEAVKAFLPTIGNIGKAKENVHQAWLYLAAIKEEVVTALVKLGDRDPKLESVITNWMTGQGMQVPDQSDKAIDQALEGSAPENVEAAATPPQPAPPTAKDGKEQAEPKEAPKSANEAFISKLEKAIKEDGVTEERPQTLQPKTKVWQKANTGVKNHWYDGGIKAHGYGSGNKFNSK